VNAGRSISHDEIKKEAADKIAALRIVRLTLIASLMSPSLWTMKRMVRWSSYSECLSRPVPLRHRNRYTKFKAQVVAVTYLPVSSLYSNSRIDMAIRLHDIVSLES